MLNLRGVEIDIDLNLIIRKTNKLDLFIKNQNPNMLNGHSMYSHRFARSLRLKISTETINEMLSQ